MVFFPRTGRKNGRAGKSNSVQYAEQVISSVKAHYGLETGHRPGLVEGGNGGGQLRRVIKGLRMMSPRLQGVRLPILQHHLRAVRRVLNLESSQLHRVLWDL